MVEEIYQVDEISALIGLLRRAATSYLVCEVMEQFERVLERLTSDWYPDTGLKEID